MSNGLAAWRGTSRVLEAPQPLKGGGPWLPKQSAGHQLLGLRRGPLPACLDECALTLLVSSRSPAPPLAAAAAPAHTSMCSTHARTMLL